jgi:CBS domain-containing protein
MHRRSRSTAARRSLPQTGLEASCCVAEVMGTELFTLTPDTVVESALRLASQKRIHHFLVVEEGSLTGIVAQNDLRRAREGTMVAECMSTPVLCIGPETTVREAADIMSENKVSCLPVVTGAFLVGVVTRERLIGMGFQPVITEAEEDELLEEDEDEETGEMTCAACGDTQEVRRDLRAGLIPLCSSCASVMPSGQDHLRAN